MTARLVTTAALVGVAALAALALPRTAAARDLPILQRGDEGPAVAFWQRQVNEWLDAFAPNVRPLPTIGVYGPRTETLTRRIQREAGITVDDAAPARMPDWTWTRTRYLLALRGD